jgi:hypothetical protein
MGQYEFGVIRYEGRLFFQASIGFFTIDTLSASVFAWSDDQELEIYFPNGQKKKIIRFINQHPTSPEWAFVLPHGEPSPVIHAYQFDEGDFFWINAESIGCSELHRRLVRSCLHRRVADAIVDYERESGSRIDDGRRAEIVTVCSEILKKQLTEDRYGNLRFHHDPAARLVLA